MVQANANDDQRTRTFAPHARALDSGAPIGETHADKPAPHLEAGGGLRPMTRACSPRQNQLLAALVPQDFAFMSGHLELVWLPLGELLYEPGVQLKYAYFPTTAIVSLHYVVESGGSAEIAAIGNEGLVGVSLLTGGDVTIGSATVQVAGHAYRLPRAMFKNEFERRPTTRRLLLLYTQALITQIAQNAVCNRYHTVEQQLCRWLLMARDRACVNRMAMTHELLATALGVRRESITAAAGKLQRAGCINYRHGQIEILDRSGLEAAACECYTVVKNEFHRLFERCGFQA